MSILLRIVIIGLFIGLIQPVLATLNLDFLYFYPDSVQSNYSSLKRGVDLFFKQSGDIVPFQAFSQKVDFDKMVKDKKPALVFVPVWYYRHYGESLGLQPLMTALKNGQANYTKVLLVHKDTPYILADLTSKTIAMTTMGPDTGKILTAMYREKHAVDLSSSNIIITPKDADSLYALALGQVDAALVGRDTLEVVGSTNPRVLSMVQELAISEPLPMPLLCVIGGKLTDSDLFRIQQLFMEGSMKDPLPTFWQMLKIDGWKNIYN